MVIKFSCKPWFIFQQLHNKFSPIYYPLALTALWIYSRVFFNEWCCSKIKPVLQVDGVDESEICKHACFNSGQLVSGQINGPHSRNAFKAASSDPVDLIVTHVQSTQKSVTRIWIFVSICCSIAMAAALLSSTTYTVIANLIPLKEFVVKSGWNCRRKTKA